MRLKDELYISKPEGELRGLPSLWRFLPMTSEFDGSPEQRFPDLSNKKESYFLCRFIFVRGICLIYLIAFFSLFLQIDGLFGSGGILSISRFMRLEASLSTPVDLPTVFWLGSSDSFLRGACAAGMIFALLAAAGIFAGPSLLICWFLYLSFLKTGADFMSFQWDILLLESGLLGALWAPWVIASAPVFKNIDVPPSRLVLWLLRWLLFRLMLMSGLCKLLSGDPSWWNLTALAYHYETQPLPTPLAWFCHLLPLWFQQLSCLVMFVIEIVVPFFIFGNRLMRRIAFGALTALQVLILLTGNYTFFNWLTILLCFTLIEDTVWQRFFSVRLKTSLEEVSDRKPFVQRFVVLPVVALLVLANFCMLSFQFVGAEVFPVALRPALRSIRQFHLVNGYGLFAVMTQKRIEIVIEGSNDAKEWRAYEFPFKPGDLKRMPPLVAPLQPRLDWQMWFAALGTVDDNPWFISFVQKLLVGDGAVVALLSKNPFPDSPPKYIRAQSYEYHFSDAKELAATGNWWQRKHLGEYLAPVTLDNRLRQ